MIRPLALVSAVILLVGCGQQEPPKNPPPSTATETKPTEDKKKAEKAKPAPKAPVWSGVVLRPAFTLPKAKDRKLKNGTGFAIKDKNNKLYLVTAAHLLDSAEEWKSLKGLEVHSLTGEKLGTCGLKPVYLGRPVNFETGKLDYAWDSSEDMAVYPINAGARVRPLPLASDNPKFGDAVWFVGREFRRKDGNESLYAAKVETVVKGSFQIKKKDRIVMPGYSGCPIVNPRGEVVGILTSGIAGDDDDVPDDSDICSGGTINALRQHLKESGVQID